MRPIEPFFPIWPYIALHDKILVIYSHYSRGITTHVLDKRTPDAVQHNKTAYTAVQVHPKHILLQTKPSTISHWASLQP